MTLRGPDTGVVTILPSSVPTRSHARISFSGREDRLLLLFTAALAVQRPPEDHQRYRRDDAEAYGQRDRPKPDHEYPCDEGAEDHYRFGNDATHRGLPGSCVGDEVAN